MKECRYFKEYASTSACTLRMAKDTVSSSAGHKDTFYGDSWFASVRTAQAISDELNCHFIGHIKQSHKRFPKEWLEETMKAWPGGTHLVLRSCFGKRNLVAVGYKYNKTKVCMFIMTKGAELTKHGDPYVSKYLSQYGNLRTREVRRPLVASRYFKASGAIDGNNQIRQSEIALEEHWISNCGWFRSACAVVGIVATNSFYASNHSFSSECEYSRLKAKDFVSILAHQLTNYPFPEADSFGRSVVRPGETPPEWFDVISTRFVPNVPWTNPAPLGDVTNEEDEARRVGKITMKPGWDWGEARTVCRPTDGFGLRAPFLSVDIRETHKLTRVRVSALSDGTRHRPSQCKVCSLHGLKQKKPPFLCVECGDFFCHDSEKQPYSKFPRQCYWTHMCMHYRDSGLAAAAWKSEFAVWNQKRVQKCKESDGL
jgi:hypothetical protein